MCALTEIIIYLPWKYSLCYDAGMQQPVAPGNSTGAAAAGMEAAVDSDTPSTIINTPIVTNASSDVYGGRTVDVVRPPRLLPECR